MPHPGRHVQSQPRSRLTARVGSPQTGPRATFGGSVGSLVSNAPRGRPKNLEISTFGRVAEWFKAPVLKDEWARPVSCWSVLFYLDFQAFSRPLPSFCLVWLSWVQGWLQTIARIEGVTVPPATHLESWGHALFQSHISPSPSHLRSDAGTGPKARQILTGDLPSRLTGGFFRATTSIERNRP